MRLLSFGIFFFFTCLNAIISKVLAQSPTFFHLTTADGLTDNNASSLVVDKKGFLWIGTMDGLNVFDGYSITSYTKKIQPAIASDYVIHLTCDNRNRIWLGTPEGITWVDEKRTFHRVILNDTLSKFPSRTIIDTKTYGPVLYTLPGQFYFNEKKKKWEQLKGIPAALQYEKFSDAEPFRDDTVIFATSSEVLLYDYTSGKVIYQAPFTKVVSVCRYSDSEIAIAFRDGWVRVVNYLNGQITHEYHITRRLNNQLINPALIEVRPAVDGSMLLTTDHDGLVVIDRENKITWYTHDPINKGSIGSNHTRRVICSPEGDVIVGSSIAGVSSFDIYNRRAGYKFIFHDGKGAFYDNYVADLAEDRKGIIWIGAFEKLIRWDKEQDQTRFFEYPVKPDGGGYELRAVCVDSNGRVWAGSLGNGLSWLDQASGQFRSIKSDSTRGPGLRSNLILDLLTGTDGRIWVSTTTGFYTVNPATFETDGLKDHKVLGQIANLRVNYFFEDKRGRLWLATHSDGIYCYNKSDQRLIHYNKDNGFPTGRGYAVYEDSRGDIYVSTSLGFTIISPSGKLSSYDQSNGLKYDRCDGVLEDNKGRMWISNIKCLFLFDRESGKMNIVDQNMGLSAEGFRPGAYLKTKKGEFFWGSRRGVNYFFPDQLTFRPRRLKVTIAAADRDDTTIYLVKSNAFDLRYARNNILFRFTAVNLQGSENINYRFMLEGYDETWQEGVDVREARYSLLPSGKYNFKVEASPDKINWTAADNMVSINVIPPLWRQAWFIVTCIAILIGVLLLLLQNRNLKLRRQNEELEKEQAIRYFTSSMSEQRTEQEILSDVAKNCTGRLHFEDCSIYMKEEGRDVFVLKAADGPKRSNETLGLVKNEIKQGEGIIGTVLKSGRAIIVKDTTRDPRYIPGIGQGLSEIVVPILYNDLVLGVIDCEHSKKSFFTEKHLSILTTIASLCANRIVRARAERQKKEAEAILTDTQRKMTEVEMQALRAQMNPHFIFNCLNSINRYIVKSDQTTASFYLTKFSKLIRLILDNSNSKNVILTNELEALKLYIEMEALRFDKKFTYEIKVEDNLGTDNVEVPPLIIQPYVENAIWHGLLHKETNGHLSVRVGMMEDSVLRCVIEDNGIGRQRAKELKSKTATSRKSLGMELTENRLSLLNKHAELNASVEIIDLENGNGESAGTKVIIQIPV